MLMASSEKTVCKQEQSDYGQQTLTLLLSLAAREFNEILLHVQENMTVFHVDNGSSPAYVFQSVMLRPGPITQT
jgi:hypothetical protein